MNKRTKIMRRLGLVILTAFCVVNVFAFTSAYSLTHFRTPGQFALGMPRPNSDKVPSDIGLSYQSQRIPVSAKKWLETWFIPTSNGTSQGTVILFPGNGGSKATQLLASAQAFHELGYDTLLVDFRGVGGSSGNTTTLGMREAQDVATAANYAQRSNYTRPFILYGVSIGSAAVLKATAEGIVQPAAIILELPFTTMLGAVKNRIKTIKAPTFPMAELMVFWGGLQHGFNGFSHNPVDYASQVDVPTLLLQGELDKWTTQAEVSQIVENLQGAKQLVIFPEAGHGLLVTEDKAYWRSEVDYFLKEQELKM